MAFYRAHTIPPLPLGARSVLGPSVINKDEFLRFSFVATTSVLYISRTGRAAADDDSPPTSLD